MYGVCVEQIDQAQNQICRAEIGVTRSNVDKIRKAREIPVKGSLGIHVGGRTKLRKGKTGEQN